MKLGYSDFSIRSITYANTFATDIKISNGSYNTRDLNLLVANDISALMSNSIVIDAIEPVISLNNCIFAPINKGDVLGSITYEVDGSLYRSDLIASHDVEESEFMIFAIYVGISIVILIIGFEIGFYLKSLDKTNCD